MHIRRLCGDVMDDSWETGATPYRIRNAKNDQALYPLLGALHGAGASKGIGLASPETQEVDAEHHN